MKRVEGGIIRQVLVLCAALAVGGGIAQAQKAMDMATFKKDSQVFERILDERLRQSFSNPFAVTGDPQASYLQGYGLVVTFHVNLNRARVRTPFGERDVIGRSSLPASTDAEGAQRGEQLERIREMIVECLAQYAAAIQQLSAHDRVSISAHIEDRNELDPARRKTVLVVTASRDDVDLYSMRQITSSQFRDRLHILQY